MSHGGHWVFNTVVGGHALSFNLDTIFTMWFAMLVVLLFAFIATRKLSIIPNKLQAVSEALMRFFWGVLDTMIPSDNRKHVPLAASLFLFPLPPLRIRPITPITSTKTNSPTNTTPIPIRTTYPGLILQGQTLKSMQRLPP